MRVHPLVIHLRGGVRISVAVPRDLPRPPHIVVADSLPPDARLGLLHPLDSFVNPLHMDFILKLISGMAVPALHQVNDIKHDEEGQGDVDVAIGAGTVMIHHGLPFVGTVKGQAGDLGDVAPHHSSHAAVHEHGQQQAFPEHLSAHGLAQ